MKDLRSAEAADVYRAEELVGTIRRTRAGSTFEYAEDFYETHRHLPGGIAIHLPYSQRRFDTTGVNVHPYFAGLLPEGIRLRALVKTLKTSEDDLLTLLMAAGADTIGDLSVVRGGRRPRQVVPTVDVARLRKVRFAELLRESLETIGADPTIPGVQEKVSAAVISFPLRAKRGRRQWILKLNPPDKPRLVENEAFFMRMAARCGIETAASKLVRDAEGNPGLLVERFDRRWNPGTEQVDRIHQEDACQFLDRYPADKYRIRCREILEGLGVCVSPAVESLRLLELVAFSYIIANGDLHAKNVSIASLGPAAGYRLTPAYDLLSTLPYGDRRLALQMEGRLDNLRPKDFVAAAARVGVSEPAVRAMLENLTRRAGPFVDQVAEIGLDPSRTKDLQRVMTKRTSALGS